MEAGHNLFITGRAGTGKSTLLRLYQRTTHRRVVVLAPTGVAALNVAGQTIHSFFGFPPRLFSPADIKRRRYARLYELLDCIIIDEISMVRADLLDNIDYFLRLQRGDDRPFGGVQMVFFGDLYQLPPVVASPEERELFRTQYASPYFFSSYVLRDGYPMEMVELQQVYRQENRHFLRLLDAIRSASIDEDDLADLNLRHVPDFEPEEFYLTLSARNANVNAINQQNLEANPLPARNYLAEVKGGFKPGIYPTDPALQLKVNAQVMFLRNDPDKAYVNGTIGRVIELKPETVVVRIDDPEKGETDIEVSQHEWEISKYVADPLDSSKISTQSLGSFKQLPLRLAWAVTIHKAQGKTFDRIVIDMGKGAFEHGQTYVALSRCRTLDGIVLRRPLHPRDLMVDPRVVEYYEGMR